jgi:hypothetical protein
MLTFFASLPLLRNRMHVQNSAQGHPEQGQSLSKIIHGKSTANLVAEAWFSERSHSESLSSMPVRFALWRAIFINAISITR